jgi:DNA-binding Lrp family transcriptional regulator
MTVYYILIDTKPSFEHHVSKLLKDEKSIMEIDPLIVEETAESDPFFENYDLLAKIDANDYKSLLETIDTVIKPIDGVNHVKILTRRR